MITPQTKVVGVQPRIGLAQFKAVLAHYDSPALADEPDRSYKNIVEWRVDPLFALAIFYEESKMGHLGVGPTHKSPGNCRTHIATTGEYDDVPGKGRYAVYATWPDGFKDLAARLADKSYVYGRQGLETIIQIIPTWAPEKDNNSPNSYIRNVVGVMNNWGGDSMALKPGITWIGSPNFDIGREGEKVEAICDHIMQGTLVSTDGWFGNKASKVSAHFGVGLDGTIHQYVDQANTAWANGILQGNPGPDWLKECQARGINPNNRTVSIEHEGYTGNPMPERQYQATLALHRWLLSLYPAVKVDRDHIVGHYQISPTAKPNCPGAGFPWGRLMSDLAGSAPVEPKPVETNLFFKETGYGLGGGFLAYWRGLAALGENAQFANLGLPISNEFDITFKLAARTRTVQLFERGGLVYEVEGRGVWNVHLMNLAQLAETFRYAAENNLTRFADEFGNQLRQKDSELGRVATWGEVLQNTLEKFALGGLSVDNVKQLGSMVQAMREGQTYEGWKAANGG